MESLYEHLLKKKFLSSRDAIEFCRESCLEYGFDIQRETSDNRSVYLQCLYEVSSETKENPTLRKRPSSLKDTECPWRLVITKNELSEWVLRKSSNASEHNHPINNDSGWPQEMFTKISQLARQKNLKTDEIRETIKLQFPHITWNDRRFLNYLKEEQKRASPQNSTTERVQRLIMASTRLCSVVAANEDWSSCVEGDLIKLLESYAQLTRVSAHQLDSMVDLELDMIHSEIDKSRRQSKPEENELLPKKRKSANMSKQVPETTDTQVMSIPSCTLYVRSQPLRSMSEPSSQNRRAFTDMITSSSSSIPQSSMTPFGVGSLFSLTSPVSSPSSTSSIQQRIDYGSTFHRNISNHSTTSGSTDMLQSPSIPDSNMIVPPSFGSSGGSNTGNGGGNNSSSSSSHHHNHHHHSSNANYSSNIYPIHTPYSAYTPSPSYTTQSGDMSFFDSSSMGNTSTYQHLSPSPVHMMVHRPQPASSSSAYSTSPDRMTTNYPMNYYPIRDTSSSSSIQQRIMLQQEYEQHQRHLQQMEPTRANNQLPIIRTNTGVHLVQQPNHSNLNSNTWS